MAITRSMRKPRVEVVVPVRKNINKRKKNVFAIAKKEIKDTDRKNYDTKKLFTQFKDAMVSKHGWLNSTFHEEISNKFLNKLVPNKDLLLFLPIVDKAIPVKTSNIVGVCDVCNEIRTLSIEYQFTVNDIPNKKVCRCGKNCAQKLENAIQFYLSMNKFEETLTNSLNNSYFDVMRCLEEISDM